MNWPLMQLGGWLVDYLIGATVVLSTLATARLIARRPQTRVALAWGAWLGLALLAVASLIPGRPRIFASPLAAETRSRPTVFARPSIPRESTREVEPSPQRSEAAPFQPVAKHPTPIAEKIDWLRELPPLLTLLWLFAALASAGWMLLGWLRACRLVAHSHEPPTWARQELARLVANCPEPGLRTSDQIATAVALGAARPRILLPVEATRESNRPAIRAALAHEWAHIRRGDLWLLSLERLLLPLLALHPLFWWLRRGVRHDQEFLADAEAAGEAPLDYAAALVAWARDAGPAQAGGATLAIWEPSSPLARRIQMLLQTRARSPQESSRLLWGLALVPFALAVGLSLVTWRPTTAQSAPPASAAKTTAAPLPEAAAIPATNEPQVLLDVRVFSLDRRAIFGSGTTLRELVIQTTDGIQPIGEEKLVFAEIPAEKVDQVRDRLGKLKGVSVLAAPQVLTVSGREASIRVGNEEPVLLSSESVNGVRAEAVVTRLAGTELVLRPTVFDESISIRIAAEQSSVGRGEGKNPLPSVDSRKLRWSATIAAGGALLFAEAMDDKDERPQPLFVIQARIAPAATGADAIATPPPAGKPADESNTADKIRELERLVAQLRLELGATKSASCLKCHAAGRRPAEAELSCPAMPPKEAAAPAVGIVPTRTVTTDKPPATVAAAPKRLISRDLKILDIRAAESEFQAAREEFDEAQKMHQSATISAAELRVKRLAVERAQIALERAKLELEQFDEGLKAQP
ncbi:MAG: M56 family metallopeptidase [Pirellulaceae bacterium]|nr:M56 family metallopeptidase [Pirellulaceae bacterium]